MTTAQRWQTSQCNLKTDTEIDAAYIDVAWHVAYEKAL
jgi:hypothetical protein